MSSSVEMAQPEMASEWPNSVCNGFALIVPFGSIDQIQHDSSSEIISFEPNASQAKKVTQPECHSRWNTVRYSLNE